MPPKLSIVIPAFNEAARLELSLRKIVEYFGQNLVFIFEPKHRLAPRRGGPPAS